MENVHINWIQRKAIFLLFKCSLQFKTILSFKPKMTVLGVLLRNPSGTWHNHVVNKVENSTFGLALNGGVTNHRHLKPVSLGPSPQVRNSNSGLYFCHTNVMVSDTPHIQCQGIQHQKKKFFTESYPRFQGTIKYCTTQQIDAYFSVPLGNSKASNVFSWTNLE